MLDQVDLIADAVQIAHLQVNRRTLGTAEQFSELNAHLDTLLDREGRARSAVRRTLMTRLRYGSRDEVREQVAALEAVGVQRLMLGWPELDDLDGIAALGAWLC